MSNKRSFALAAAGLLAAAAALAGCSPAAAPSPSESSSPSTEASPTQEAAPLKISMVHGLQTDVFHQNFTCGAKTKAKELGVELTLFSAPGFDSPGMQQALSAAVLQEADGMILNPFSVTQFSGQIEELMQDGIPVISWNVLQPPTQWTSVRSDTDGNLVKDQFVSMIPEGPGTVAVIGEAPGNPATEQRWKPLIEELQKQRPDIQVPPVQYDNGDLSTATQIASGYLSAFPDLKLILGNSLTQTAGAVAAIEAAERGDTVKVWGYNAVPSNIEALKKGIIVALGAEPSFTWGEAEVELLTEFLRNRTETGPVQPSGDDILLPMKIITLENLNDPDVQPFMVTGEPCKA